MMKRLFLLIVTLALCPFAQVNAQKLLAVSYEDSLYSPSMNRYMRYSVILPPGYAETSERYTTLYLLHGLWGNYRDWITNTGVVQYASAYRFLIIAPDGGNGWWTNSKDVRYAKYEDFIMNDLIPAVDLKYRTLATRHGRAIAGLSMGGYGAAKFAIRYPGSFFYAASFSGALSAISSLEEAMRTDDPNSVYVKSRTDAFGATRSNQWTRNDVFALLDSADAKQLPYFYVSVGHSDFLLDASLEFGTKLRRKGAAYEFHETIGTHDWLFWDREIRTVLDKLERYDPLNVK
ncbi:MAG TPA: alpha/beta hydrolase family protein [Bacteroidota bacterium]|nr:alpha/beta hydrolase family protein [Bacteroidota bacterium]